MPISRTYKLIGKEIPLIQLQPIDDMPAFRQVCLIHTSDPYFSKTKCIEPPSHLSKILLM